MADVFAWNQQYVDEESWSADIIGTSNYDCVNTYLLENYEIFNGKQCTEWIWWNLTLLCSVEIKGNRYTIYDFLQPIHANTIYASILLDTYAQKEIIDAIDFCYIHELKYNAPSLSRRYT